VATIDCVNEQALGGGRVASCVISPWTLFLRYNIIMDVAAVPTTFRPSIESHIHADEVSLLFVYFSDSHRPALAPLSLSTTTTTRYYYLLQYYYRYYYYNDYHYFTCTIEDVLPCYTAYRWRGGEKAYNEDGYWPCCAVQIRFKMCAKLGLATCSLPRATSKIVSAITYYYEEGKNNNMSVDLPFFCSYTIKKRRSTM